MTIRTTIARLLAQAIKDAQPQVEAGLRSRGELTVAMRWLGFVVRAGC